MAISMASMICRFLKISPIWNPQRLLWWNKAALKAHLLTSPLMFCSNAIRWKPSLSKNTSIPPFSIHSLGTFAWDQLGMGGILETDRKNHFHFHFFMIFNFAASNLATVSKEQMYGWGTIGCTARTATPTMRVNFFSSQGHQTSNKDNFTLIFQGWSSAKCDCDWRKKIYTRLSFTSTAWVASWPVLDRVKLLLSDCNVSCISSTTPTSPNTSQSILLSEYSYSSV